MSGAVDDQQFCLRWNNFQANITSQFETLRDEEDFTDVTIACEGQRIQAHKIVLSACSPFFKELFKTNPCAHPIVFMRDVETQHIMALMEFMYTGEVNVAQAQLSTFLKTAESLKIRGLTDTSSELETQRDENKVFLNPQPALPKVQLSLTPDSNVKPRLIKPQISSCSSTVTSSQDIACSPSPSTPPPSKKHCKDRNNLETINEDLLALNTFTLPPEHKADFIEEEHFQPKLEIPEYLSDDDGPSHTGDLTGGMEIIPHPSNVNFRETNMETSQGADTRKLHSLDPRPCQKCGRVYSNLSNLRQHMKLIHFPTCVECSICKKTFKTDLYLKRHMISSHDPKRCLVKTNDFSIVPYNTMNVYDQNQYRQSSNQFPQQNQLNLDANNIGQVDNSSFSFRNDLNNC